MERMREEETRQRKESLRKPENPRVRIKAELDALLDPVIKSIGIADMLSGIGRDIWGVECELQPFSQDGPYQLPGVVIDKGFKLVYGYEHPIEKMEDIFERRFSRYSSEGFWAGGGLSETQRYYISTKTKIGWHEERVGYNIDFFMDKRSTSMGVYLRAGAPKGGGQERKIYRVGFLDIPNRSDGLFVDEPQARKMIERVFLEECLRRERNKSLPKDLAIKSQTRFTEIQIKMQRNPYSY